MLGMSKRLASTISRAPASLYILIFLYVIVLVPKHSSYLMQQNHPLRIDFFPHFIHHFHHDEITILLLLLMLPLGTINWVGVGSWGYWMMNLKSTDLSLRILLAMGMFPIWSSIFSFSFSPLVKNLNIWIHRSWFKSWILPHQSYMNLGKSFLYFESVVLLRKWSWQLLCYEFLDIWDDRMQIKHLAYWHILLIKIPVVMIITYFMSVTVQHTSY